MKTDSETPIMGSVCFSPSITPEELKEAIQKYGGCDVSSILQAPLEPLDRFDALLSFRDFLKLKKEVTEAYDRYLAAIESIEDIRLVIAMPPTEQCVPWPEALQGLTREDIEILKL